MQKNNWLTLIPLMIFLGLLGFFYRGLSLDPHYILASSINNPTPNQAYFLNSKKIMTQNQQETFDTLTHELRCLVCQNQTLADSQAPFAYDLKNQVATLILNQKNSQEILDYLIARYGNFILYKPPVNHLTYFLWGFPIILLFIFIIFVFKKVKIK